MCGFVFKPQGFPYLEAHAKKPQLNSFVKHIFQNALRPRLPPYVSTERRQEFQVLPPIIKCSLLKMLSLE